MVSTTSSSTQDLGPTDCRGDISSAILEHSTSPQENAMQINEISKNRPSSQAKPNELPKNMPPSLARAMQINEIAKKSPHRPDDAATFSSAHVTRKDDGQSFMPRSTSPDIHHWASRLAHDLLQTV